MSKRFTPEEDKTIQDLIELGFTYLQIARKIGRSEEGVRYRDQLYRARGGSGSFGSFTKEEDYLLLKHYEERKPLIELSTALGRPTTMLRKRLDTLKKNAKKAKANLENILPHMRRDISDKPADFPIQAQKHLEAILREDPRGFPAYTDTGNKYAALAVKLPLIWKGAN